MSEFSSTATLPTAGEAHGGNGHPAVTAVAPKAKRPAPKPKAKAKPAPAKAAAKGKAVKGGKGAKPKPDTRPKSLPMPGGRSVHADEPQREPRWSESRVAVMKALRKLRATGADSACTAGEISAKCSPAVDVKKVKVHLDVYRTGELLHNGYAASVRHEGDRELSYYLTPKGAKADITPVKD